jgi:hypothetical protein
LVLLSEYGSLSALASEYESPLVSAYESLLE